MEEDLAPPDDWRGVTWKWQFHSFLLVFLIGNMVIIPMLGDKPVLRVQLSAVKLLGRQPCDLSGRQGAMFCRETAGPPAQGQVQVFQFDTVGWENSHGKAGIAMNWTSLRPTCPMNPWPLVMVILTDLACTPPRAMVVLAA